MSAILSRIVICGAILVLMVHATMAPAHAYLDPSMGSFIIQAVAGTLLAGGLILKRYWHWFKTKLLRIGGKDKQEPDEQ